MSSAIVVGSGPNGLACAAVLASRGVEVTVIEAEERIGGGTRSSELTVPGLLHDECSATHPMVVDAPATVSLELERHGLEFRWPEVDLAHPLDGGGASMLRSLDAMKVRETILELIDAGVNPVARNLRISANVADPIACQVLQVRVGGGRALAAEFHQRASRSGRSHRR